MSTITQKASENNRTQIMGALRSMAWATAKLHEILIYPENYTANGCDENHRIAVSELQHAVAQLKPVQFMDTKKK